jgi:glutamate racemase
MDICAPIVVLDSGLGGLTVARALRRYLPHDDLLYFGDTARLPYGTKTGATVTGFVREIISYFRAQQPKHVVIACNTATALALPAIRADFPELAISGVVEPGAAAAVEVAVSKDRPTIGIIATEATIKSKAYEKAILKLRKDLQIFAKATPLLVPLIEEGRTLDDPIVRLALEQYLAPLQLNGIDVLMLGCTHYPIVKSLIAQVVGDKVAVIDAADRCAEDVAERLRQRGLTREQGRGTLKCFVTDDPNRFSILASRFMGVQVDAPQWVSQEELQGMTPIELRKAI